MSNNNAQKGETQIQLARYSPIMDICFKLDTNLSEGLFSNRAVYENVELFLLLLLLLLHSFALTTAPSAGIRIV